MSYKLLSVHRRWIANATISETIHTETSERQFTATILGFRHWKIYHTTMQEPDNAARVALICERVRSIQSRIIANDESVFTDANTFIHGAL